MVTIRETGGVVSMRRVIELNYAEEGSCLPSIPGAAVSVYLKVSFNFVRPGKTVSLPGVELPNPFPRGLRSRV